MLRISVLSTLLCLCIGPAMAQELLSVTVTSGVEKRIGGGWNCSNPQNVPNITVMENPTHGTIAIRDLPSGAPCNNGPIKGVFYTSRAGYKGPDRVGYQMAFTGRGNGKGYPQSYAKNIIVK